MSHTLNNYSSPPALTTVDYWRNQVESITEAIWDEEANPGESYLPQAIAKIQLKAKRLDFMEKYLMTQYPVWDRRIPASRPKTLPEDCDWWNGINDFEIEADYQTESLLKLRSYVAGGNYETVMVSVRFPTELHYPA